MTQLIDTLASSLSSEFEIYIKIQMQFSASPNLAW